MAIKSKIFIGSLVAATTFSAFILSSTTVKAETYTKTARIQVTSACTLTGNVATPHSRNVAIATYEYNIGETDFSAVCNDSGGFAVYAIGFTGDTDGNNKLVHSTNSSIYINTGLAESGNTSAWAMKLTAIENAATPTIHNGYSNYSLVPDDYVKVASYPSTTTASASSMFKSYYAAYVSPTQSAGIYNGKVKYVMVHPSTAAAPTTSFDDAFAAANKTKDNTSGKYKMSDMSTSICNAVTKGETGQLVDVRDGTVYRVGKMLDGRCWMQDNLALNLLDSTVQTTMVNNPSYTNADADSLTSLFSGNRANGGNYAKAGVSNWTGSHSYSAPLINVASVSTVPQSSSDPLKDLASTESWKVGIYYNFCAASAGSYCYGSGTNSSATGSTAVDKPNTAIDAEYDICPSGWRLPTGYSYNATNRPDGGEFQALYNPYRDSQSNRIRKALRFPLSGNFGSDGSAWGQGTYGRFWSSTYYDSSRMYYLLVSASGTGINPQENDGRSDGCSVRCIAK